MLVRDQRGLEVEAQVLCTAPNKQINTINLQMEPHLVEMLAGHKAMDRATTFDKLKAQQKAYRRAHGDIHRLIMQRTSFTPARGAETEKWRILAFCSDEEVASCGSGHSCFQLTFAARGSSCNTRR